MIRIPQDPTQYQATLLLFFEEEVMGEAMFAGLADHFSTSEQREKLSLLSRMERCVIESVRPLVSKYGLRPRGDMELLRSGSQEAARYRNMTWLDFIKKIDLEFPVFLEEFAALARVAPAADLPLLVVFDEHEIATIAFARRELTGDPTSSAPLVEFLRARGFM
jgi:hypothetical protein